MTFYDLVIILLTKYDGLVGFWHGITLGEALSVYV